MVSSFFIFFYFFFKLILAKNFNETNFLYQPQNIKDELRREQLKENITPSFIPEDKSEEDIKKELIDVLEQIRKTPKVSHYLFIILRPVIWNDLDFFFALNKLKFLCDLTKEIFSQNSTFLNDLFDVIKKEPKLINYTIILVKGEIDGKNLTDEQILDIFHNITNINGMDKVFSHIINSTHNDAILELIETQSLNENYTKFYGYFKPILTKYKDPIIRFLYQILKIYKDKNALKVAIKNFFLENRNSSFLINLKEKFKEEEVKKEFIRIIKDNSIIGNIIKEELLKNGKIFDGFFDLFKNEKLLDIICDTMANFDNNTYIEENIPRILRILYDENRTFYNFLLNVFINILKIGVVENSISANLSDIINERIYKLFFEQNVKKYNININCTSSFRKIYFDRINIKNQEVRDSRIQMRNFFMKKSYLDSTKNKNDFLTFENCLEKDFDTKLQKKLDFNFTLKPTYILAMIDDNKTKANLYDSIYIEQYDYWFGQCLPSIQENCSNGTGKEICSKEDYSGIVKIILGVGFNMESTNVSTIKIDDKNFSSKDKIYCAINFIIILIPLIIQIILFIYYSISIYRFKKRQKINQLKTIQEEEIIKQRYLSFYKKNVTNLESDKIIFPKWYKYLNEYFNLIKNGAELFNKNSKVSNVNNIKGITYIKGLLGISMILYIFGHLFLILFNLPFKNLTPTAFIESVKHPFFCIPIVGLRYSPRIILSCSGYTLIYKYISYIEEKHKFYMIKFILRQSYRYLLLLIIVLYMRFSVYYLNIILSLTKRPMMEILKYNLENNNRSYFVNFFTCLLPYIGDSSFKKKQNIIQYFYIPLNEIFMFSFGIILISLGYKYKLRNDIIIIIIILSCFIAKIFIYGFYVIDKKKYSTLYFYLYDYGAIMLNPLFNLSSFLIGMFFGLINYSIQKGINIYGINLYQKILTIDNKDLSIVLKESVSDNEQPTKERRLTIYRANSSFSIELNNFEKSKYTNRKEDELRRSYSREITNEKNIENKIKSYNKNIDNNFKINNDSDENKISFTMNLNYDKRIKEMPFFILPTKFLNFYKRNEGSFYFILIIIIFVLLIAFFTSAQFIYVGKHAIVNKEKDNLNTILEKLSFKDVIIKPFLNFIYVIDIDLVVFMVNWIFFTIYSKGSKSGDIYNFFDNNFWAFFLKCYYSFIVISTPII